jgi:hypothetical protein
MATASTASASLSRWTASLRIPASSRSILMQSSRWSRPFNNKGSRTPGSRCASIREMQSPSTFLLSELTLNMPNSLLRRTIRFAQSTLVSVCPSFSHLQPGYHRFPLFSEAAARTRSRPFRGTFAVDLHTAHAPIIACGCTPIRQLFPPALSGADSSVLLYAVKRRTEETSTASTPTDKPDIASKQSMYLTDAAW